MAKRLLALVIGLALIAGAFYYAVRPWYLRWGAASAELQVVLPGDEIVPGPATQETRAITIYANVDQVWPWLAQLGQDRGGFYSFDLLENMVGCKMPTEDRLRLADQQWRLGDKLWMYPPYRAGGAGFATLRVYLPGRAMGFGTRMTGTSLNEPENGSWSFVVQPIDQTSTRLLVRGRGTGGRSLLGLSFDRSIFEPAHFVMERRMMMGIKQLAEGGDRGRWANHAQIVLWTITFGFFVAGIIGVLRVQAWKRPLAGMLAAAAVFQILTFGQPPVPAGLLLVVLMASIFRRPKGRSLRQPAAAGSLPRTATARA